MARYADESGVILDTEKAVASWEEKTWWNGSNHISNATGSQWEHETLYRSSKGNYWIKHTSQMQGSVDTGHMVSRDEAARWLACQDIELPEDLKEFESQIVE